MCPAMIAVPSTRRTGIIPQGSFALHFTSLRPSGLPDGAHLANEKQYSSRLLIAKAPMLIDKVFASSQPNHWINAVARALDKFVLAQSNTASLPEVFSVRSFTEASGGKS